MVVLCWSPALLGLKISLSNFRFNGSVLSATEEHRVKSASFSRSKLHTCTGSQKRLLALSLGKAHKIIIIFGTTAIIILSTVRIYILFI